MNFKSVRATSNRFPGFFNNTSYAAVPVAYRMMVSASASSLKTSPVMRPSFITMIRLQIAVTSGNSEDITIIATPS